MPTFTQSVLDAGQAQVSDSGVAELQRVLKAYAEKSGFAAANPGEATGIVDTKTALSVIAVIPKVPGLPDEVKALSTVGAVLIATDTGQKQVFDLIKRYAGYISKAIVAMAIYQATTSNTTPTTPTAQSIKAGTIWSQGGDRIVSTASAAPALPPIVATSGGLIPGNPEQTIWFYDALTHKYRVAAPAGPGLNGPSPYVEVSPSESRPAAGTEVSRTAFMKAVGKWWWTPTGIAAVVGGVIGLGALTFAGVRALVR